MKRKQVDVILLEVDMAGTAKQSCEAESYTIPVYLASYLTRQDAAAGSSCCR